MTAEHLNQLWSWLLSAVGVTGLYLAGRRRRIGWAIGLAAQLLWVTYAIVTVQWGFIAAAFAYGAVNLRNFLAWKDTGPDHQQPAHRRS